MYGHFASHVGKAGSNTILKESEYYNQNQLTMIGGT